MEILKNLEKYKFCRKMFKIKVIEFKKIYLLIILVDLECVVKITLSIFLNGKEL